MIIVILVIVLALLAVALVVYVLSYPMRLMSGFRKYYQKIQENQIAESNGLINKYLIEYSKQPTLELSDKIIQTLRENQSFFILTYIDNNDPNDNKTLTPLNAINFRKIKDGKIIVFTDFDLMKMYVRRYVATDIILVNDFIRLCKEKGVRRIVVNHVLPNPFVLEQLE